MRKMVKHWKRGMCMVLCTVLLAGCSAAPGGSSAGSGSAAPGPQVAAPQAVYQKPEADRSAVIKLCPSRFRGQ